MGAFRFFFNSRTIDDNIFARIRKFSFREAPKNLLKDLLYVEFPYYDFYGDIKNAAMIINKSIIDDVCFAFREFFSHQYGFGKIVLIDCYGGDDNLSMADNNTSCFNYRKIANSAALSNHALAMAIDINPKYNPYVRDGVVYPFGSDTYADRNLQFAHKISHEDLAYEVFVKQLNWEWGGDWMDKFGYADYQHFSKIHKSV